MADVNFVALLKRRIRQGGGAHGGAALQGPGARCDGGQRNAGARSVDPNQALFDELAAAAQQLSTLTFRGPATSPPKPTASA
jgi:hypothetical protein